MLSAYQDNASVIEGNTGKRFYPDPVTREYGYAVEDVHILMKVETHNHPTAIAPFPGAATGAGGEIRDEGAVGRGSKPKAGLTGYSVSNLRIPGAEESWEVDNGKPDHISSALDIMIQAPVGGAAFNNEFGRPNICGYFRSYELQGWRRDSWISQTHYDCRRAWQYPSGTYFHAEYQRRRIVNCVGWTCHADWFGWWRRFIHGIGDQRC